MVKISFGRQVTDLSCHDAEIKRGELERQGKTELSVRFWGTRGSFPAAAKDRIEYGGNTCCVSVAAMQEMVILDAGTGLAELGKWIKSEDERQKLQKGTPIYLFLGHLHIDHVVGLFQFLPFFDFGRKIVIFGEEKEGKAVEERIGDLICPPLWPVPITDFPADIQFQTVRCGERYRISKDGYIQVNPESGETYEDHPDTASLEIDFIHGNHPNGSLLSRIRTGRTSVFYGLDCEMDEPTLERLAPFCTGCDLLICDAQYLPEQLKEKKGWGHSSWKEAIELCRRSKSAKVICSHYEWGIDDEELHRQEAFAGQEDIRCSFARESQEIRL